MAVESASSRVRATVKFFEGEKGFGFCSRSGDGDVFVHRKDLRQSGINDDLKTGELLEFETVPVPGKAPKAVNIRRVSA